VWPSLRPADRTALLSLLAGFCVGEAAVARELEPYALATSDENAMACFRLQAGDEARHARFFDRVAAQVARVPGASPEERRRRLRPLLDPGFLDLFEVRLRDAAAALGEDTAELGNAVVLYHILLEGIVFTAGQRACLAVLEKENALPGVQQGIDLVVRDERWHIGFGVRMLQLIGAPADVLSRLLEAAKPALACWGDAVSPRVRRDVLAVHRRRVNAARLITGEIAA
jgi:ribonucleoside-diphosphate reductase beta chain